MARIECKCGETMSNTLCPNDIEYHVYSDRTIDKICENDIIDVLDLSAMSDYDVWLCPKCKRLYVFEGGGYKPPKYIYKLESET